MKKFVKEELQVQKDDDCWHTDPAKLAEDLFDDLNNGNHASDFWGEWNDEQPMGRAGVDSVIARAVNLQEIALQIDNENKENDQ
jgi:hypothetical protein